MTEINIDPAFYLRSRHGDTGSNVVFHNKDGCGYGTNLDKLHVFTKEEAQQHLEWDIRSLPLLKSAVDSLAIRAVDMQYLDVTKHAFTLDSMYVIQVNGKWNGNDIYFKCDDGQTYNYDKAVEYSYRDAVELSATISNLTAWNKDYLNLIARRTFQAHNISTRKMITGPGIKYKKPRKPRPTTGKTRGNCPSCGKITWDYNPYENAYCKDYFLNRSFSDSQGCH